MGDLRLQQPLHGIRLGQVQGQVTITVDGGNVGPMAQEVPGGKGRSGLPGLGPPPAQVLPTPASPGNVQVPTGGSHVQGGPALVVGLVHSGTLLH